MKSDPPRAWKACLAASGLLLMGCSGGEPAAKTPELSVTESSTPSPDDAFSLDEEDAALMCPNPYGGGCLGKLDTGTYQTEYFQSELAYTVPSGWANWEDLPTQFILLPPDRKRRDIDATKADYLAVNRGVTVPSPDCTSKPMPGVGQKPTAIVAALRNRPGLITSQPRRVAVGGRQGLVVDIERVPGPAGGCKPADYTGPSLIPIIMGIGEGADFEHSQAHNLRTRLYVLDDKDSNIVIEVSQPAADTLPFDYEPVVESFRFGTE